MDWGTLSAAFIGSFTANILAIILLAYFIWPKIRKALNPLGQVFEDA